MTSSNEYGHPNNNQCSSISRGENIPEPIDFYKYNQCNCVNYNTNSRLYSPPFFRGKIHIDHHVRVIKQSFGGADGWTQKYITIKVKNTGHNTLHQCYAELSVIRSNNLGPEDDSKQLTWGRYPGVSKDLTAFKNIQANGEQILHVMFSHSDFVNTSVSDGSKRYACVFTFECLTGNNVSRTPHHATYLPSDDSFSDGKFIIKISITSEEAISKDMLFLVDVNQNYDKLNMRTLPIKNRIKPRYLYVEYFWRESHLLIPTTAVLRLHLVLHLAALVA